MMGKMLRGRLFPDAVWVVKSMLQRKICKMPLLIRKGLKTVI